MFNVLYCIVVTIRPVYRKFVLPSRKSLEIIINKKNKKLLLSNLNCVIAMVAPTTSDRSNWSLVGHCRCLQNSQRLHVVVIMLISTQSYYYKFSLI